MDVSKNESTPTLDPQGRHPEQNRPFMFHERMAIEKINNPGQTEFWIHTESTASGILIPMAATTKHMSDELEVGSDDRAQLKQQAAKWRHAVSQGKALDTLRALCPLEAYGMMLMVPSPEECARQAGMSRYVPQVQSDPLGEAIAMANYQANPVQLPD